MHGMRPIIRPAFWQTLGPLQRRLGLVAAIALVPLAALALANVIISAESQRDSVLQASTETARAVSSAIDAEISASVAALETLTLSPRLDAHDLRGFHAEARELLTRHPTWANISLADSRGQQRMNAMLDFDG